MLPSLGDEDTPPGAIYKICKTNVDVVFSEAERELMAITFYTMKNHKARINL
jgi:hypothetical protein